MIRVLVKIKYILVIKDLEKWPKLGNTTIVKKKLLLIDIMIVTVLVCFSVFNKSFIG